MTNDTIIADAILAQKEREKEKQAREEAMAPVVELPHNKKLEQELANPNLSLQEKEAILVKNNLMKDTRKVFDRPLTNTPTRKTFYTMAEANLRPMERNPRGESLDVRLSREQVSQTWDEKYGPLMKKGGQA